MASTWQEVLNVRDGSDWIFRGTLIRQLWIFPSWPLAWRTPAPQQKTHIGSFPVFRFWVCSCRDWACNDTGAGESSPHPPQGGQDCQCRPSLWRPFLQPCFRQALPRLWPGQRYPRVAPIWSSLHVSQTSNTAPECCLSPVALNLSLFPDAPFTPLLSWRPGWPWTALLHAGWLSFPSCSFWTAGWRRDKSHSRFLVPLYLVSSLLSPDS